MKRPTPWFILLSFIWPAVQILFFWLRFGRPPDSVIESLYFLPMGMISAGFILFLMNRAKNRTVKVSTAIGYLVACPFAMIGSLGGGLVIHPLIGVTLFGSIPLLLGSAAGYWLGKLPTENKNR
ncbi:MAG: hypothetical protein GY796_29135 [Chloroflexi bacterium]|nr:hypothetical protein [Chloroflexota bacterium]